MLPAGIPGGRAMRTSIAGAIVGLVLTAAPAAAYSLVSLEPQERASMLNACQRLHGSDRALCRDVVEDHRVIANYKRSCLQAMTLLMQGSTWARVKSLPPTLTCREGLGRAGYPVHQILRRLTGGS
jgi:hypothetical protein